jgi:hypothetical protein
MRQKQTQIPPLRCGMTSRRAKAEAKAKAQRQPRVLRLAALAQDGNINFGLMVVAKVKAATRAAFTSMLG